VCVARYWGWVGMFICVGHVNKRLRMSMQSLYSPEEMFDRASSHLTGKTCNLINCHGVVTPVAIVPGVSLEFGPGLFTRIQNEDELRLASRIVTTYHDSLRTESEQLDIEDHERALYETWLLEEACTARMHDMGVYSDSDGFDE
jgi:hypothetical protein